MALEYEGVTPESPAGTDTQYDGASSAGTENTGIPAPPPAHTIPYERFKEVNDGYRSEAAARAAAEARASQYEQQIQATRAEVAELRGQLQRSASQVPTTPEEAREQQAALAALRKLNSLDPEYQKLVKEHDTHSKIVPLLTQTVLDLQKQMAGDRERNSAAYADAQRGRLYEMAQTEGMTFASMKEFSAFENYVAGIIRSDPNALAAFQRGDARILPAAVKVAKEQYDAPARAAKASLAQTKAATSRLPPRIGGGQPGSPPPPRFDPKDPRGSMDKIHAAAEAFLSSQG
jgi:hypothetical protein